MKKFEVGDKVFHTIKGFGKVVHIIEDRYYPVRVKFNVITEAFSSEGKTYTPHKHPSLFHSPQEASEYFSKIKRKEKRVLTGWVSIYANGNYYFYETKKGADLCSSLNRIACVPIEQEVEYEV